MKEVKDIERELKKPFKAEEIEWRIQSSGKNKDAIWAKVFAYVQNRAIQDRLDEVVGIDSWQNVLRELPNSGMSCGLSLKINGEWITKWDGADNTDIEATKGGISNAMKRSATQWGIGRYLYELDTEYAETSSELVKGWHFATTKDKDKFWWKTPDLPSWALPKPKSLLDEAIEDLAKKLNWNNEKLIVNTAIKYKKLYKNLTQQEKESFIEYLKKEAEK